MSGARSLSRASLLTPTGRGAVAVIATEGPAAFEAVDAHFEAANRLRLSDQAVNRIVFGQWTEAIAHAGVDHREEVIVCRTSASELEIHCHGGIAAAERILGALAAAGCRVEPWPEWLGAHAASLLDAEAETALAGALTRRTAAILLDQRQGALRREVEAAVGELRANTAVRIAAGKQRLGALLDRAPLGLRLTRPWQVAIGGRPNVGKSSLINALVGYERAIVFDQPGTTRDVLAADTAIDGWPVRLSDGAGLRATSDPLEAAGVELAQDQLGRADLVIWVLDATALAPADLAAPSEAALREMAVALAELPEGEPLVVANKSDLVRAPSSPLFVGVSALTGTGISELLAAIARRLVPRPPEAGVAVPFAERQVALIRRACDSLANGDVNAASSALSELLV